MIIGNIWDKRELYVYDKEVVDVFNNKEITEFVERVKL